MTAGIGEIAADISLLEREWLDDRRVLGESRGMGSSESVIRFYESILRTTRKRALPLIIRS
jgi:hypothetical protein